MAIATKENEMRLIDVDALKKYINDCEFCRHCPDKEFRCFLDCELPNCVTLRWRRVFDEQPTIEAVKHGEWIPCSKSGLPLSEQMCREGVKWYGYKCSVCNNIRKGNALREAKYCEECGARMDKDETD